MANRRPAALPRTAFVESLDSARYASRESAAARASAAAARVDTILALLFGYRVVLPEPYSFDSAAFLDIAAEALDAWRRNPAARRSHPFLVALQPHHQTFRQMVAARLRDPKFILSGFPQWDRDQPARESLARAMSAGGSVASALDPGSHALATLDELSGYFTAARTYRARLPKVGLRTRIEQLQQSTVPADLMLSRRAAFEEWGDTLAQLQRDARLLQQNGVDLTNRSAVRLVGRQMLPDPNYGCLVEAIDSAYNEVVLDAARAITGSMGTPPSTEFVRHLAAAQDASRILTGEAQDCPPWNGRLVLSIDAGAPSDLVESLSFDEVFACLADTELHGALRDLHNALDGRRRDDTVLAPDDRGSYAADQLDRYTRRLNERIHSWRFESQDGWFGAFLKESVVGFFIGHVIGEHQKASIVPVLERWGASVDLLPFGLGHKVSNLAGTLGISPDVVAEWGTGLAGGVLTSWMASKVELANDRWTAAGHLRDFRQKVRLQVAEM